jgi:isopenicillin-N epimerase
VIEFGAAARTHFQLEPGTAFLNHGSFGAAPRVVLEAAARWRSRMEQNPDRFYRDILPDTLREAAARLGAFIRARGEDVVFVENATAGMNAVLRSLEFRAGDEILATTHSYGAVRQAIRYVCKRTGARSVEAEIRLPIASARDLASAIASRISERTRLLVLDHIASPTGLVFPVAELAALARAQGALVLVDGAHAPGQIPLDVPSLGIEWYVANCHKWLFAPRTAAFIWSREEAKALVHPLAISHDYGRGFTAEFDWTGTRDVSPWLAVTAALDFVESLGAERVRQYNHALVTKAAAMLAAAWRQPLDGPAELHGAMMAIRLPARLQAGATREDARRVQSELLARHGIVVAIMALGDALWARISAQIYNAPEDYERLLAL